MSEFSFSCQDPNSKDSRDKQAMQAFKPRGVLWRSCQANGAVRPDMVEQAPADAVIVPSLARYTWS